MANQQGCLVRTFTDPQQRKAYLTQMTWKMGKVVKGAITTFLLSGRAHADHLRNLKTALGIDAANMAIDLREVTLVEIDAIQFLGDLELKVFSLRTPSPYIREWIGKEQNADRTDKLLTGESKCLQFFTTHDQMPRRLCDATSTRR